MKPTQNEPPLNSPDANPYAPPQTEVSHELPKPSFEILESQGPISFSGVVDSASLHEYLRADGHVGCGGMLMGLICVGLISLFPILLGGGVAVIAIGCLGIVVLTFAVSTIPYRRLVFQNINPDWNRPKRGQLRPDGVTVERDGTTIFFRWDWYDSAIVANRIVAFLPATQRTAPLLIAQSMLPDLDQWARVQQVAQAVAVTSMQSPEGDQRRYQNERILRDRKRPRTVEVPHGAVPFQGPLTAAHLESVPERFRPRQRPARTYVVNTILIVSIGVILSGISLLVFRGLMTLPIVVSLYIVAAVFFGRWRNKSSPALVNYLNAFATEASIVSDFALTTADVPWSALQLVLRNNDTVVLRRREWIQFVVARRRMFASDEAWRQFNDWADQVSSPNATPS